MPPADRIATLAQACLDAVVDYYTAEGEDLPPERGRTIGPPAWDCERVAVWVERGAGQQGDVAAEGSSPLQASAGFALRAITVRLQIVRCVPTVTDSGKPPGAAAEDAAAVILLRDAQLVSNAWVSAQRAGLLAGCNDVQFLEWVSVGPEGGYAASTHALRMSTAVG